VGRCRPRGTSFRSAELPTPEADTVSSRTLNCFATEPISYIGAGEVRWAADGRSLVFKFGRRHWRAEVETDGAFRHRPPTVLADGLHIPYTAASGSSFSVTADGPRLLLAHRPADADPQVPVVVLGWATETLQSTAR
jgi:hypothetical protein